MEIEHPDPIDITEDFEIIPEAPTVTFTENQAKYLVSSLIALRPSMEKYGIVKIILPDHMKPKIDMTKTKRKLFVRQQILSQLPNGKVSLIIFIVFSLLLTSKMLMIMKNLKNFCRKLNKNISTMFQRVMIMI